MKRTWLVLILPLGLFSTTRAEGPVSFMDANLRSAVESDLGIPDPTPTDMLTLTYLHATFDQIADLTGLEYAVNLRTLILRGNQIQDVSPITGLKNLETLNLSMNRLTGTAAFAGLTSLRSLDIHDNPGVTDISGLAGLAGLEVAILRHGNISNISPLAGLSHLREVDLYENLISNISPLSELRSLQQLDLRLNLLDLNAYQIYIPRIQQRNPGVTLLYDESSRCQITLSAGTGGSVALPGEGRFLYACGEDIWVTATAEPGFMFLHWSGSYFGRTNRIRVAVLDGQRLHANFVHTSAIFHVDDDAPGDGGPQDPRQSDPRENGTTEHPFDSIQKAIEAAAGAAAIFIEAGIYRENLNLRGKDIHLLGKGPAEPAEVPWPILEGAQAGPVVQLGGSGSVSSLAGLIITGGIDQRAGAVLCHRATLSISNCLIVGSRTSEPNGAAVYGTDSEIVVTNCTIADNSGGAQSAAITLVNSNLAMTNSILWNDTQVQVRPLGTSRPDIRYCAVAASWPGTGNTPADPKFVRRGAWLDPDHPDTKLDPDDTRARWVPGDYHLQSQAGRWDTDARTWIYDNVTSPCIDRGGQASLVGHEPAPNGGIINLGVYGGTSEASKTYP